MSADTKRYVVEVLTEVLSTLFVKKNTYAHINDRWYEFKCIAYSDIHWVIVYILWILCIDRSYDYTHWMFWVLLLSLLLFVWLIYTCYVEIERQKRLDHLYCQLDELDHGTD